MTINPKIGFIAALIHGVLLALTGLAWSTVLDAKTAAIIVFVLAALDSVTQAIVNGFSSNQQGPLVK